MANEFKIKKGLIVNGSGSIVLDIQGSQGQLFSVTDQLTGTLFSVSDISGIPILEVDSDDTIRMGTFGSEAIIVSGSHATVSGSFSGSFQGDGQSQWDDVTGGINYANGNVGIGTTSPGAKLDVNGATYLRNVALDAISSYTGNSIQFTNAGNTTFNNSNVGIGTTSPSQKLQVQGGGVQFITTDDNQRLFITSSPSSQSIIYFGDASSSTQGRVAYENSSDSMYFNTASSEKMRILANGNVGIGTSSPSYKLSVAGKSYLSGGIQLNSGDEIDFGNSQQYITGVNDTSLTLVTGGSATLTALDNGNVGIGTTAPAYKLDVTGPARIDGVLRVGTTAQNGEIEIIDSNGKTFSLNSGNVGNNKFAIEESDTNVRYLVIDGVTSNVGIGTTSPSFKLDVAGTGNFTGLVSGITPVNAANFVTKAYADGLTPGAGVFLPLTGGTLTGNLIITGGSDIFLADNGKTHYGASNDLEVFHNGSDSYIIEKGTGDLRLQTTNGTAIKLQFGTEDMVVALANSSVSLYHDSIKKLETATTGITITGKATSTATITSDGSSTLTTKGYVDSLITGATIYRGAWDPSGGGYGSPDLSTATQTSGYYYICSAAGTAEPNGTGTEPDTWEVGDWVIYNDVSGTGQWQKIDNSSVLSGVGTGQTVALWEGAGSVTDSETLGNAPITVSGNNTTFAGTITLPSNKSVNWPGGSIRAEGNTLKVTATTLIDLQEDTQVQGTLQATGQISGSSIQVVGSGTNNFFS
ncbi:hypothetical protein N9P57_00730, partial [Planktomarina temperata]|nr:hypothetical protein [Planktomarina temperata]